MEVADLVQESDLRQIKRALQLLKPPNEVTELRVPKTKNGCVSGYFNDPDKLASAAAALSGKAPGVYVTLNPVSEDLLARSANRVSKYLTPNVRSNSLCEIREELLRTFGVKYFDNDLRSELEQWEERAFEEKPQAGERQLSQKRTPPDRQGNLTAAKKLAFDLRQTKSDHQKICKRLDFDSHPTPSNSKWAHLSWTDAIGHPDFKSSVKAWISKAVADERRRRQ